MQFHLESIYTRNHLARKATVRFDTEHIGQPTKRAMGMGMGMGMGMAMGMAMAEWMVNLLGPDPCRHQYEVLSFQYILAKFATCIEQL